MATLDTASVQLGSLFSDKVKRALRQNSKLLSLIPVVGGKSSQCKWAIDGYGSSASYQLEGASLVSTETADSQIGFAADWARVVSTRKITSDAIAIAQATGNPMDNANLRLNSMIDGFRDIVLKIGQGLYAGDGTSGALLGLVSAIDDSNTYGGVNRAISPNYPAQSQVFDPGSPTAISFAQIRADVLAIVNRCGQKPTVAVCGAGVFAKVLALFDANAQYPVPVNLSGGKVDFNAGGDGVMVQGIPFVFDPNCTASAIYYLNQDGIEFRVLPPAIGAASFGVDSDGMSVPVPVEMFSLPADGLFVRFGMQVMGQLAVTAPSWHGVRLNIVE